MILPGRDPIYMDHNATTPCLPEVVEAMVPFFTQVFGNPSSSTHSQGARAAEAVASARRSVAALLGADPDEIVFTAGATESDNLALRGACAGPGPAHVVACVIEHEAVLETCADLARHGVETTILPVDGEGLLDPAAVARALRRHTRVVSVMMANNEIGVMQPVEEIARTCREQGVLFHTDAVQAAGRVPLDVGSLEIDLLSLTAHKMYGPKGVGALYVRKGVRLEPMVSGGGQEGGLRSGTLNVPGIAGFGAAARAAARDMKAEAERELGLRERLWRGLRERVHGVILNGHPQRRLPNNLNVAFEGVEAEALLTSLRGVAALSAGSACASSAGKGSYVIRALAGESGAWRARSSVRFGLGRGNTEADVDRVVQGVEGAVARLRSLAPAPAPRRADAV
ncbi:MAG TPA: cysteine desulfurase family protein [Candidatus Polarisedimenticolia bacterium]|nr:cysteine desulfurase family protein [Candidatus Polarisedimenticolia bacterium]